MVVTYDSYKAGSECTFPSEPEWRYRQERQDKHVPQSQFENSMINLNNDTTHELQVIQQSQWDHANNLLTDDIPTLDGKPEL